MILGKDSNFMKEKVRIGKEEIEKMNKLSTKQVKERFSWEFIVDEYEILFTK